MKSTFAQQESRCEFFFRQAGPYWHLYTPENYPIFFTCDEDFRAGMTLIAICAINYPSVKILAFQWMNNHLHIVLCGAEDDIDRLFRMLKRYLSNYLKNKERAELLNAWEYKLRKIGSLNDLRNAIAYVNRNGFLVKKDCSPLSYPWGANKCLFNKDYAERSYASKQRLTTSSIRELFHTRDLDGFKGLKMLDGHVCPSVLCDHVTAEGLFRNESHYFYSLSKSVENMKEIAKEIGESIYYNDNELFTIICDICRSHYNIRKPSLLPATAKMELAKKMHYEYNAGIKQISRILRLDPCILSSLFG